MLKVIRRTQMAALPALVPKSLAAQKYCLIFADAVCLTKNFRMTSTSNKPPQSEEAYINSLQQAYINKPQKPVKAGSGHPVKKPQPQKPVKPGSGHPPSIVVRIVSGLNRKLDRFEVIFTKS